MYILYIKYLTSYCYSVIEIVPIKNYGKLIQNQIKINNLKDRIKDLHKLEGLNGKSKSKQIQKITKSVQKLENTQEIEFPKVKLNKKTPSEVIVVFEKYSKRKNCLEEYSKYSNWYSRPKKMSPQHKLNREYAFKVSEAPEPSEYQIEYIHLSKWLSYIYIAIILAIFGLIASFSLYYSIKSVDHAYSDLRLCRSCIQYDFSSTTVATLTAENANRNKRYCFCRYNGWDRVQDSNQRNSNEGGLNALCNSWSDDYRWVYYSVAIALAVMYIMNLIITYGFKLLFDQRILRFNKKSHRYMLVSASVFLYTIVFLGIMPLYTFDDSHHDLDREWYLLGGNLYILYFLMILFLQPLEGLIYFLISKMRTLCAKKKHLLQKDLNKLFLGKEFDYSHKIGRLLGHAWIVYFLGAGLPLLFPIFCVHLALFFTFEKLYILKFYRKMDAIS